jgi:uncharacterized protein YndB with AHSA1/START domain
MSFEFTLTAIIPASPREIYDAWLDAEEHAAMTGGKPAETSAELGGSFTAWDGYITGQNLTLEPGRRIVQSWRTTKFTGDDPDSQIELLLEPVAGGTRVTLRHSNVPEGHTSYRDGGWQRSYFEPMVVYFSDAGETPAPAKPAARKSPKKKPVRKTASRTKSRKTKKPAKKPAKKKAKKKQKR